MLILFSAFFCFVKLGKKNKERNENVFGRDEMWKGVSEKGKEKFMLRWGWSD